MVAPQSQQVTSESWNGHWGTDARYYARRSDGSCFAIDSAVNVFDLAAGSLPWTQVRPVDSLPLAGRYTLSVFAVRPLEGSRAKASGDMTPRLYACGVRRRA